MTDLIRIELQKYNCDAYYPRWTVQQEFYFTDIRIAENALFDFLASLPQHCVFAGAATDGERQQKHRRILREGGVIEYEDRGYALNVSEVFNPNKRLRISHFTLNCNMTH